MKLSESCIQRWYIKCTDGFSMLSEMLHLTLKRSNALTNFRWCQKNCILMIECIGEFSILSKNCIWFWNNQMHWQIFDFWRRQVGRRTNENADKQTERNVKWNDVCWLLKQANWFAKKWWKQWFNRDAFKERAESIVNKQLIVTLLKNVPEIWKKKSTTMIRSWRF